MRIGNPAGVEAEAQEEQVKQVKAAEAEEQKAIHKAKEINTIAQAQLEAASREAEAQIKRAEGAQAQDAAKGLAEARRNIEACGGRLPGVLGINLGKNRDSADAAADYRRGVEALGPLADYLVINVSSPNTPGLRALQGRGPLEELLGRVQAEIGRLPSSTRPPLVVKIAPDLTDDEARDVADVALALRLAGISVGNTTTSRPPRD